MIWKKSNKPYRECSLSFPISMNKKTTKHDKEAKQEEIIQEETNVHEPEIQVVEKIVYKKQRVHGFFRTLTIITLLAVGILMLGESMNIAKITINGFPLDTVYPVFVIFSTIIIWSYRNLFGKLFGLILFLGVFGGFFTIRIYNGLNPESQTRFGQPIQYTITGDKNEQLITSTLIGEIHVEGNTKSPYIQGIWESDRPLNQDKALSGTDEILSLTEDNTINLLEQYVSKLTLFAPSAKRFTHIYLKNAIGEESVDTTNLNREKITFHGWINKVALNVTDCPISGLVQVEGAIQDITLTLPKDIWVTLLYKDKLGQLISNETMLQSGYTYTSTNNLTAKKKITIKVNIGIGRLTMTRN